MRTVTVFAISCSLLLGSSVQGGAAPEREVAVLELPGKPVVTLTVLRQRSSDGGLKLRLAVSSKGEKKLRSVTLYEGGADDDGPTDKAFRSARVEPFALAGGKRGARVDFEFQIPGSKRFRQVDSYLVAVDETPRLVLEATTRRERKRTKACHEVEECSLTLDKEGRLFLRPVSTLESELDDDDLPIDKACHGKQAGQQVTYKFDGERFFQVDPPPAPKPKAPSDEEDSDD